MPPSRSLVATRLEESLGSPKPVPFPEAQHQQKVELDAQIALAHSAQAATEPRPFLSPALQAAAIGAAHSYVRTAVAIVAGVVVGWKTSNPEHLSLYAYAGSYVNALVATQVVAPAIAAVQAHRSVTKDAAAVAASSTSPT